MQCARVFDLGMRKVMVWVRPESPRPQVRQTQPHSRFWHNPSHRQASVRLYRSRSSNGASRNFTASECSAVMPGILCQKQDMGAPDCALLYPCYTDRMITHLSIVIPAYNEAQFIPMTLESLAQQDFLGHLEVLVVDGDSTDDTVAVASSYKSRIDSLRVIRAKRDVGHQRNVGAEQADYPYLLFLDADVILPPGTLNALAGKVKSSKPFIATVFHVSESMNVGTRAALFILYLLMGIARLAKCPVISGDFLLTTRETHDRIAHGFAENFLLGEDTDYGLRCVRAGARYHFYWSISVISSDRRARELGRLRLILVWARAFIHVIRKGPVPKTSGLSYPFGHYGQADKLNGSPGIGLNDRN